MPGMPTFILSAKSLVCWINAAVKIRLEQNLQHLWQWVPCTVQSISLLIFVLPIWGDNKGKFSCLSSENHHHIWYMFERHFQESENSFCGTSLMH